MQFNQLVFTRWHQDHNWLRSQPLIYKGTITDVRVYRHADWVFGENVYDVDQDCGDLINLHEDIDLFTLCSAVLPFCEPMISEETDGHK